MNFIWHKSDDFIISVTSSTPFCTYVILISFLKQSTVEQGLLRPRKRLKKNWKNKVNLSICGKFYCRIRGSSQPHTAFFWNIIIQWSSLDDLTEKLISLISLAKLVKNSCMDPLEKKEFYCIRIYSIFCRASPFHREWPHLVTILTSFDLPFEKKFKSLKY